MLAGKEKNLVTTLAHHGIWVSEYMMHFWMHGKMASIRVLTNVGSNHWDGSEDYPYDCAIESTLFQCLTSLSNDIMIISYYKLLIAFNNFGEQGKAATKNGRKKAKRGTFIDSFLAVLAKSFVYYQKNPDFTNGFNSNFTYQVFLNHQIEVSSTTLRAIQGRGHQASVYPSSHSDINIAELCSLILETQSRSKAHCDQNFRIVKSCLQVVGNYQPNPHRVND
ncbi:hypothetical protein DSO57_1028771 [Entomophthora muscae]|uniref:Uncharacterized protein n=1 Tax=Entomophthora muscae TaxID=34485 RepID=A0ACC2T1K3_9FUNG|nr:hypothetical protein DSO57_1028771 [Entomophthora muscae]